MTVRTVAYGSASIEYNLTQSERTSLTISVHPDGTVDVTAPHRATPEAIDERVLRRARWILRQVRRFDEFRPRTPPRRFVGGETHRYLGRQYRLKIQLAENDQVALRSGRIVIDTRFPDDAAWTGVLVRRWLRMRAGDVLRSRFLAAEPIMASLGIGRPKLMVCAMTKRWGSHTASGRVILNSALIAAPRDCIDYVIVHELCHVVEPNHSPRFWSLLRRYMPDWERRKERLERCLL